MTPEAQLRVSGGSDAGQATVRSRETESPIAEAIRRGIDWFLSAQNPAGYWWGELEADTTLESDYILYLHILGELKSEKTAKLAKYIRDRQLPGRRLEHLLRWAFGTERDREGVGRAAPGG